MRGLESHGGMIALHVRDIGVFMTTPPGTSNLSLFFVMKIHDFISIFIFSCFLRQKVFYISFFSFCGGNPPSHNCVLACILLQTFKRIFSCPSPIMIIKKATVEASLKKKLRNR